MDRHFSLDSCMIRTAVETAAFRSCRGCYSHSCDDFFHTFVIGYLNSCSVCTRTFVADTYIGISVEAVLCSGCTLLMLYFVEDVLCSGYTLLRLYFIKAVFAQLSLLYSPLSRDCLCPAEEAARARACDAQKGHKNTLTLVQYMYSDADILNWSGKIKKQKKIIVKNAHEIVPTQKLTFILPHGVIFLIARLGCTLAACEKLSTRDHTYST